MAHSHRHAVSGTDELLGIFVLNEHASLYRQLIHVRITITVYLEDASAVHATKAGHYQSL